MCIKKRRGGRVWLADLAVGVLCCLLGLVIFRSVAPGSAEVLLPGTALSVRLTRQLTSQSVRLGDVFEAWVDSAQGVNGAPSVPAGTRVEGRCVAVRGGTGDGRPGYLRLALSGLWDAEGRYARLETTTISLAGKAVAGLARQETLPATNPASSHDEKATGSSPSNEAVATPGESLTFILLKPAVIPSHR